MAEINLLAGLTSYGSWEAVDSFKLSEDKDFNKIERAEVVEKELDWGTAVSICLFMKGGTSKYLRLSPQSDLEVGDPVDLDSIEVTELEKDGKTIHRADGEVLTEKPKTSRKK